MGQYLKTLLVWLLLLAVPAVPAVAGETPVPGSNGNLICNVGGLWSPCVVGVGLSNTIVGGAGTLANTGVASYPGSGVANSTGSGWGTSYGVSGSSGTLLETNGSGASLTGLLWSQIGSTPTTLSGYGITSPLPVAQGGTAVSSASGTALDNITGFSSTGYLQRTGAGTYGFTSTGTGASNLVLGGTIIAGGPTGSATVAPILTYNAAGQLTAVSSATITPAIGSVTGLGANVATALGNALNGTSGLVGYSGALGTPTSGNGANLTGLVYTALPSLSANNLLGALTATTPSGQSVPSCSGTGNGLNWTSGTGFGCPTFLTSTTGVTTFSAGTTGLTPSSGTSGAVTLAGTLAAANGGTGQTSVASAFTSFFESVATTLGDIVYGGTSGTPTRLAGSTSASQALLTQTGTGSASAAPAWTAASSVTVGTASAANAINSATTTVNTNSATAPAVGQVLTATSSTAAKWQPPTDGAGPSLALFYTALSSIGSQIVRIENLGDSILTCNQAAPCAYGPSRVGSTFALLLVDELSQHFQQYSTGFRAIVRLSNGTTTVSAADGYTLTSGTLTNSTLLGPQESGVSLNGGSLLTNTNGGVITIAVGQPYSSVNIACVQGSGVSGYTVTINGSSVGTACGSGSGANTATIQNFANPVAQASQPATGSTLTLTALGATNYFYAYEAVLFCGAAQSACTAGFTVDNFGVGGASSPWFASGTKTGGTDGGMVWVKALSGQIGLCVLENGENDAQASSGPVTSTQQNAQNQIAATDCLNKNASVLFWVPPPYNNGGSPAVYAGLQQGSLTYCQSQGWVCLNMADLFMGDQSGTLSSLFPFSAQNTGMGVTPPWGVAQGMITNSDSQHLTDCGEVLATQQFMTDVFKIMPPYPVTQACSMNPQSAGISSSYTNATTGYTIIQGASANTGQLEFVVPVSQTFSSTCRGYMQVGTTGIVDFELVGASAISVVNMTLSYQTTATSVYTMVSASALSSALATASITAASGLKWVLEINGTNSTAANSFAVEAHEASGTLTIPAGATCTTQLSGPQ